MTRRRWRAPVVLAAAALAAAAFVHSSAQEALAVPGQEVGYSRLIGGRPFRAWWRRRVL